MLPFGLTSSCWVFTKLTRELVGHWRAKGIRLIHYLDDFLFGVRRDKDAGTSVFKAVQSLVMRDFRLAGFSFSEKKLKLAAVRRIEFLGFIIDADLKRLFVAEIRITEFLDSLKQALGCRRSVPVKLLARIAGQLQSMKAAVGPAVRVFTRATYELIDSRPRCTWKWHVKLSGEALVELLFWQENFAALHGRPLWYLPRIETIVFSDAGARGWGGFLVKYAGNEELHVPTSVGEFVMAGGRHIAQGYLTPAEQAESSTWRELVAIERVLLSLISALRGKVVQLFSDNSATAYIWLGGSRKPHIHRVVVRIFYLCRRESIELYIKVDT